MSRYRIDELDRHIMLSLMVAAILMCAGCTGITYFVVVNKTESPAKLTYSVDQELLWPHKERQCLLAPPFVHAPTIFDARRVSTSKIAGTSREASEFQRDVQSCTIAIELAPRQGVIVWKALSYEERSIEEVGFITGLRIEGREGSVDHHGLGLEAHFDKRSQFLYELSYGRN